MELIKYIYGLQFYSTGKYCNLDNYISYLSSYTNGIYVDNKNDLINKIYALISKINNDIKLNQIGEKEATWLLIRNDLYNSIDSAKSIEINLDLEKELEYSYNQFINIYQNIGIDIKNIPYFVVTEYPEPYQHLTGSALSPDKSDEIKFGITPGIYFRKDRLTPILSSLILAHEMLHYVIGQNGHELLARGLEEGLCEFIAIAYAGRCVFGLKPSLNYMIHRRLKYSNQKQKFKLYMDYFRVATYLYYKYGLKGIVSIINNGRRKIKEIEKHLSKMDFNQINIEEDYSQKDTSMYEFTSYISLLYPEHEVVSPLSFWISQNLNDISSIDEAIEKLNLDPVQGTKAIQELESRNYSILLYKSKIEYSDLPTLLNLKTYRYEI